MENNIKMYEFITEDDRLYLMVYRVRAVNENNALIKYCRYTNEIKGARMEAICSLCFESAIQLANEWLIGKIINVHEVGTEIFTMSNCCMTIIE